jgi:predicted nuclease of predicted toxin-antitoxin system
VKFGKARFYADEDIETDLIDYIREQGYRVVSAKELGFKGREDRFHLQEARRRKCILLTRDRGYLDHRRFPFTLLPDTAIVVLHTQARASARRAFAFLLHNLLKEVANSGRRNLAGLKIEIQGPRMLLYARERGRTRQDTVDVSRPSPDKDLFASDEASGAA